MCVDLKWPSMPLTITIQQYNDVKDKLGDLIPWLDKLLKGLARINPDDDPDEVGRRSQLTKFVPFRYLSPPETDPL